MNIVNKEKNYFTDSAFKKILIPALVSAYGLGIGNIIDTIVVGNMIGEMGIAAIALVTPIYMLFNVCDMAIAVGGSLDFSRKMAKCDVVKARESFNFMFMTSLALSILIGVLGLIFIDPLVTVLGAQKGTVLFEYTKDYTQLLLLGAPLFFVNFLFFYYVRNDDNPKLATVGFVVGNFLDLVLNILFVVGFDMGVRGAILATLAAKFVSIVIYSGHFFRRRSILKIYFKNYNIQYSIGIIKRGFSISSEYVFHFLISFFLNNYIIYKFDASVLAIYNVALSASYILMACYSGLSNSVQLMCSNFYGEKNSDGCLYTLRKAQKTGIITGVVTAILAFIFAERISLIFGITDPASLDLATTAVRLFAFSIPVRGFLDVMVNYYVSIEKEKYSFIFIVLRTFLVFGVFSFILLQFKMPVFFLIFLVNEVVVFIIWYIFNKKSYKYMFNFDVNKVLHIFIDRKIDDFGMVLSQIEEFCEIHSGSVKQTYAVTLTVEEICQSIMNGAFKGGKNEYIEITLIAQEPDFEGKQYFKLHIRDSAVRYNPFELKTDKVKEGIGNDSETMDNIGILMVKKHTREFYYRQFQGFNTLVVEI